jgi:hypothetical protein
LAALHFTGYEPHAARAAVARAAVIGQVDAVAQSSVQQQLAAVRQKAMAIDSNLVTSRHCLIPEGFKFPHLRLVRVTRRRCASWDAQQTKRSRSEHPRSSFGSSRIAARFEPLVFAELKIEKIMRKQQTPGAPRCPDALPDRH